MYSKIPMPQVEWTDQSMQYALCFFPFVGLVIGGIEYLWFLFCQNFGFGVNFFAAGAVIIPFLLTGGIHFDGFLDTSDAMSSWREREDRLRILKDSHVGAFAVISAGVYLLAAFGLASEITAEMVPVICLTFGLARALSGISILTFPNANPKGTAAAFEQAAAKRTVLVILMLEGLVFAVLMLIFSQLIAVTALITAAVMYGYHHHLCMKYFGGLTGDLAGYFVTVLELMTLLTVVIAAKF